MLLATTSGRPVHATCFAGGALLVAGDDDGVQRFDLATGRELDRLVGLPRPVHHVAASADGRHVAASGPSRLVVWDAASGAIQRSLELEAPRGLLLLAPGPVLFAGASRDLLLRVPLEGDPVEHLAGVDAAALSPDGRSLALCHREPVPVEERLAGDGPFRSRFLVEELGAPGPRRAMERVLSGPRGPAFPVAMAFSPDGRRLAIERAVPRPHHARYYADLALLDLATGALQVAVDDERWPMSTRFTFAGGTTIVAAHGDVLLTIDLPTRRLRSHPAGLLEPLESSLSAGPEALVALGSRRGEVLVRRLTQGSRSGESL